MSTCTHNCTIDYSQPMEAWAPYDSNGVGNAYKECDTVSHKNKCWVALTDHYVGFDPNATNPAYYPTEPTVGADWQNYWCEISCGGTTPPPSSTTCSVDPCVEITNNWSQTHGTYNQCDTVLHNSRCFVSKVQHFSYFGESQPIVGGNWQAYWEEVTCTNPNRAQDLWQEGASYGYGSVVKVIQTRTECN